VQPETGDERGLQAESRPPRVGAGLWRVVQRSVYLNLLHTAKGILCCFVVFRGFPPNLAKKGGEGKRLLGVNQPPWKNVLKDPEDGG